MERLTKRGIKQEGMIWFIDHENNDMPLEPCEINPHHNRVALEKLADYEDKEEQGLLKILPCSVGTLIHEPYKFLGDGAWEIDHHYLKLEDLDKIGKTVFVDENDAKAYIEKVEAEEALAKMKKED